MRALIFFLRPGLRREGLSKNHQKPFVITRKVWLIIISKIFTRLIEKCCQWNWNLFCYGQNFSPSDNKAEEKYILTKKWVPITEVSYFQSTEVGDRDHRYGVKFLFLSFTNISKFSFLILSDKKIKKAIFPPALVLVVFNWVKCVIQFVW